MKYENQKSGKNPIICSNKKNKLPRSKPNQRCKRPVLRNCITLEKEIKVDRNKWMHILCSWLEKLTSSKCPNFPKQFIDSLQYLLKYQ